MQQSNNTKGTAKQAVLLFLSLLLLLTEGAGAFRPLMKVRKNVGFSPGLFVYASAMRMAPQETRTYFVTAVTAQRRPLFKATTTADLLLQTIFDYRAQGKFQLHAFVIMPDHFHAMLTPSPNVSLEKAMQFIKGGFSFRLKSKGEVWMRSFNEVQIMTPEKALGCRRYIENNPVEEGLIDQPQEWPHSSASIRPLDELPLHLRG